MQLPQLQLQSLMSQFQVNFKLSSRLTRSSSHHWKQGQPDLDRSDKFTMHWTLNFTDWNCFSQPMGQQPSTVQTFLCSYAPPLAWFRLALPSSLSLTVAVKLLGCSGHHTNQGLSWHWEVRLKITWKHSLHAISPGANNNINRVTWSCSTTRCPDNLLGL
jgi:hypothetical protein